MRGPDGETLIAVWSAVKPEDDYPGKRVTLKVHGVKPRRIDAVDTLHALSQNLQFVQEGDSVAIDRLLVMDYPVVVVLK